MNIRTILPSITRFVAMMLFLAPAGMLAAQQADSAAISKLLPEVKLHAANAERDADALEGFTRNTLHWESHAAQIHMIRRHVNDLIEDSNKLSRLRSEGSPWQQQAIDHINELLPQISTQLSAMINHLSENQRSINSPKFRDYIRTNYKLIHTAHEAIDNWADYSEAKWEANALEQQLQIAAAQNRGK